MPKEIEQIISSIKEVGGEQTEKRIAEVFERIAIRSVYQNVISNSGNTEHVKVNSIEHYYRRTDKHNFWTGDIFKDKDNNLVFVATPRCNIANNNYGEILLCKVNRIKADQVSSFLNNKIENKETGETKGDKQLRTSITDDVTNSNIGERFRFLVKTPQFEGGFVDCKQHFTITIEAFEKDYAYVISLIDDLTNDVVRKLASYLLRGGIADTEYKEALYYFKEHEVK